MMTGTPVFDLDGFDAAAHDIIESRRPLVRDFILRLADGHLDPMLLAAQDDSLLRDAFQVRALTVSAPQYQILAEKLGFPHRLRQRALERIWRSEMLNKQVWPPPQQVPAKLRSQMLDAIDRRISALMTTARDNKSLIEAFKIEGLFRDDETAERAVDQINRSTIHGTSMARDLVLAWCTHDSLGLLKHADYPCITELMLLQERVAAISAHQPVAPEITATLRADLIAVYRAFHNPELVSSYQTMYRYDAHPYDQSLLHQPPSSKQRERCQERLKSLRPEIISLTAYERSCDLSEAGQLIEILLTTGLRGMFDWRYADHGHPVQNNFDQQQVQRTATKLIEALAAPGKEKILARLRHLQDAITGTNVEFPLLNLIRHLPSSKYRKKRQRRKIPEELIVDFAARAEISPAEAQSCIKNLMIYGPLGMLPIREWKQMFHPRIWSYLHLFKIGRTEGTVDDSRLTEQVNTYATSLNTVPLPKQMVLGVFSHFPKPRYYPSGDGAATAGVPLRKALKLAGVDRIHENWVLVEIELDIQLINTAMLPIGTMCSVVLVIDSGSQRPVGFWLCETEPSSAEFGLAIYDAIFHPGALHWPLRGIPENIQVPARLATQGIENLKNAATYLNAQIVIIPDQAKRLAERPFTKKLISELRALYTPGWLPGRRRAPKQQMTIRQAEEAIRKWLYQQCFPDHRTDPVIKSLRQQGVALPGHDTPAAGWLLPIAAENVRTVRDGVELGKMSYTDSAVGIEPGLTVHVRATPPRLGLRKAIFIELTDFPSALLHYLPRSSARQ